MVDRLRQSVEHLEPPTCPDCHLDMKWYRSGLTTPETVAHFFQCPNCGRVGETKTQLSAAPGAIGPSKLSMPVSRFHCAA